jgi:predicted NBD/HSP70 family sugar kinase
MSRSDLARLLRLDRSTTGSIVDFLVAQGLVTERPISDGEWASRNGGRPPVLLALNGEIGFSVGAELSAPAITLVATDLNGRRLAHRELPTPDDPQLISRTIADAMESFADDAGSSLTSSASSGAQLGLLTFAAGVSGVVDTEAGTIVVSRDLNISSPLPLAAELEQQLGIPVSVFNDADASALGEIEYGPPGANDLLFVLANIRLANDDSDNAYGRSRRAINAGLGIVLDGRLRHAHSGSGREFRSPFLPADSAEQFSVAKRYYEGEIPPEEVLERLADELGISLAFLVHALDIRTIVIGGDLCRPAERLDLFEERIRNHISRDTILQHQQTVTIREPSIEPRPIAFGASAGGMRRMFQERRFPIQGSSFGTPHASSTLETEESTKVFVPQRRNTS